MKYLIKVFFNRKVKSVKYSLLKTIICIFLYIITLDKLIMFNLPIIIIRILILFIFILSILEIYTLCEHVQNSKRSVDDYYRIDDIHVNIIFEYLYETTYSKLVILIEDNIFDIGCEPIRRRYLSNGDITKKYFY